MGPGSCRGSPIVVVVGRTVVVVDVDVEVVLMTRRRVVREVELMHVGTCPGSVVPVPLGAHNAAAGTGTTRTAADANMADATSTRVRGNDMTAIFTCRDTKVLKRTPIPHFCATIRPADPLEGGMEEICGHGHTLAWCGRCNRSLELKLKALEAECPRLAALAERSELLSGKLRAASSSSRAQGPRAGWIKSWLFRHAGKTR